MLDEWVKVAYWQVQGGTCMILVRHPNIFRKIKSRNGGTKIRDDIRHEWLSLKLLQQLRKMDGTGSLLWKNLGKGLEKFTLGDRQEIEQGIQNELEAVDYLVVTHHGLLGVEPNGNGKDKPPFDSLPHYENHVRTLVPSLEQMSCAGELPDSIFKSHQNVCNV